MSYVVSLASTDSINSNYRYIWLSDTMKKYTNKSRIYERAKPHSKNSAKCITKTSRQQKMCYSSIVLPDKINPIFFPLLYYFFCQNTKKVNKGDSQVSESLVMFPLFDWFHNTYVIAFWWQAFSLSVDLFKHIWEVHREWKCAICQKKFSCHCCLKNHMKQVHGLKLLAKLVLIIATTLSL